jgi:hypothetical protein
MLESVIAAILLVHPNPTPSIAKYYATVIVEHAVPADIDPYLLVALAFRESNFNPKAESGVGDYGLLQIRARALPQFRRNHRPLLDPVTNIKVGVEILRYWRKHHASQCGKSPKHYWYSHFQWGNRVGNNASGRRVERLVAWLKERSKTTTVGWYRFVARVFA